MPSIVLGHSVGEIAAAYVAGIFTVDEAISCAHSLGLAMLDMPGSKGVMLHTELQRKFLHTMEDSTLGFFILIFRAKEVLTSQKVAGCQPWILCPRFGRSILNRFFQCSWIMKYNNISFGFKYAL